MILSFFDTILRFIESALGNFYFLIAVTSVLFFLKATLLVSLVTRGLRSSKLHRQWLFLVFVLVGSMFENFAWLIKLSKLTFLPDIEYRLTLFMARFSWGFTIVQYQSLALFLENLAEQKFKLTLRSKFFICISSIFFFTFMGLAFYDFNCFNSTQRPAFEIPLITMTALYMLFPLMLTSLFITFRKIQTTQLPSLLKKQLSVLIKVLIIPWWACDLLQVYPFDLLANSITNSYAAIGISQIFLTYAIYYSFRQIMALRFLNFKNHVQAQKKHNFIGNFKDLLEQLSYATNMQELAHRTQTYFQEAFNVPLRRTTLYIRKQEAPVDETTKTNDHKVQKEVENFLTVNAPTTIELLSQAKILIYDELSFSNFYEKNPSYTALLTFMDAINADIFIPVYEKQKLIGYIVIDHHARLDQFYSDMERDEMLVFASYLGNVINLLQHRNLESVIHHEKELKEELYSKHQEINQYKESVRSFLRTSTQKKIGIIFYKNRHFTFGNQAAKELIKININNQEGHPLSQALKKIAQQVQEYKSPQTHFVKDADGTRLVLNGVPNLEQNNIIITVYHPEISDIITKQLDQLKDPTKWDYLLYLETTQSGQLINQLIPGSGETLLNFKIELLKTAMSKKATLLEMAEEDLLPTTELLHHIGLREKLHVLTLHGPEKNFETATKLFGMNPVFNNAHNTQESVLKSLHPTGTLFIKNIQFLAPETQEYLAEFIHYGFYRIFKSDQKIFANVRIICSSARDVTVLADEKKFSKTLANELKKTTVTMPSLMTLSEDELSSLAQGFSEQALKTQTFKNLLALTPREKLKLANQRPVSLQELKTRVQHLLVAKSKKNDIYQETQFDPAYDISDPELVEAARLGKHALRDPKIVALLWNKFKSQNQIATFLGVNRSSVSRRCKKYDLN
ncbi:hypothetical protein CVU75_02370 [Candidatus Dependentiae bacterium HGW-Dependentiae-1]|nr:MAG: hypothetical protein CVU75_02370 [Candidatus Dependentiae bacterium HGW-Dependentiae-1]